MKKNYLIQIGIILFITISCSTEKIENESKSIHNVNNDLVSINDIKPLSSKLYAYTLRVTSDVKSHKLSPNVDKSVMVSYKDSPIQAICTPLIEKEKSKNKIFHVYFEIDGMVSTFDLLIYERPLNENEMRYSYKTREGTVIAKFDVEVCSGFISNVETGRNKSWTDRFENCIEWTFDNMNHWDYLACMAIGPYCAATIATMCAIGATEGYFETVENPYPGEN